MIADISSGWVLGKLGHYFRTDSWALDNWGPKCPFLRVESCAPDSRTLIPFGIWVDYLVIFSWMIADISSG